MQRRNAGTRRLRPVEENYEIVTLAIEKENLVRRYNKIRINVKFLFNILVLFEN